MILNQALCRGVTSGRLKDTDALIVQLAGAVEVPMSIQLNSAAVGRLVELSVDGGTNFFTPVYDVSATGFIVVGVFAPITHVRLTGTANDTWRIL